LRSDSQLLVELTWDILVLDEAHHIKNPGSLVAKAAYSLQAPFKIALSGTPIENSLEDLWSLFAFLNPGFLGGLRSFQRHYKTPIMNGSEEKRNYLLNRIKPFIMRRKKVDVASDLPERTDQVVYCELHPHERKVYEALSLATKAEVIEKLDQGQETLQALEALLRLRQAACHLGLLPHRHETMSSKLELMLEHCEQALAANHKLLIFSQWTTFLDLIGKALEAGGYGFQRIDGSTIHRQTIVDDFQTNPESRILLLSIKAAGVGLNLTAADHVYIMDPWWNPAVEDQAADRAHRIGQKKPVMVTKFVSEHTVEENIIKLQEIKREIADQVISVGQTASLSRDELKALLI
jgi:SNF2 family DNA or RNA helicase